MTAVGEAVVGCHSLCYSPPGAHLAPLSPGSRDLTLQMPPEVGSSRGSAAPSAGATPGQSVPAPQMLFWRVFKELHVTIALW